MCTRAPLFILSPDDCSLINYCCFADGSDFLNRTIPAVRIAASNASETPRETCTFITIIDDVFYEEDVESFELELLLDPSVLQSTGVTVDPNIATVFIVDDDGKDIKYCFLNHYS